MKNTKLISALLIATLSFMSQVNAGTRSIGIVGADSRVVSIAKLEDGTINILRCPDFTVLKPGQNCAEDRYSEQRKFQNMEEFKTALAKSVLRVAYRDVSYGEADTLALFQNYWNTDTTGIAEQLLVLKAEAKVIQDFADRYGAYTVDRNQLAKLNAQIRDGEAKISAVVKVNAWLDGIAAQVEDNQNVTFYLKSKDSKKIFWQAFELLFN